MTTAVDKIAALIEDQLKDTTYTVSERIRTAALYAIEDLDGITTASWVEACARHNIQANTARNRLAEVRKLWDL